MTFNDIAVVSVKGSDQRNHFWYMSKNDAKNIMKNLNLNETSGSLQFFLLYVKLSKTTYYQRNRDIMLNRAKDYYKMIKQN